MTAVVVCGGKQYRVRTGDRLRVDRIEGDKGATVNLDVLLLYGADGVTVGTPTVPGISASAQVVGHFRGPKIDVLRYKNKKHVRVHRGARADLTELRITGLGAGPTE